MAVTKKEHIHPFIWEETMGSLKDASTMGLTELSEGIEVYLKNGQYHQLVGTVAPLEVWESASTGNRFSVIARYPSVTIIVQIQSVTGLGTFMERFIPFACVLPEVILPKPVQAPNNHQYYSIPRGTL